MLQRLLGSVNALFRVCTPGDLDGLVGLRPSLSLHPIRSKSFKYQEQVLVKDWKAGLEEIF